MTYDKKMTLSSCLLFFVFLTLHACNLEPSVYPAIEIGSLEKVKQMVARGANVNEISPSGTTPLIMAALLGHYDICQYLIDHGANVNLPLVKKDDKGKETRVPPLIMALYAEKTDIANLLIQNGAEVNVTDPAMGMTALMMAAGYEMTDTVDQLIKYKVRVNDTGSGTVYMGKTALDLARMKKNKEIEKKLIEAGAK